MFVFVFFLFCSLLLLHINRSYVLHNYISYIFLNFLLNIFYVCSFKIGSKKDAT